MSRHSFFKNLNFGSVAGFVISILFILFSFTRGYSQNVKIDYNREMVIKDNPPHYYLSFIRDVQVDGEGNIYLFEIIPPQVIKLDEKGNYLSKIIRNGKGPGEILRVASTYLNKNHNEIIIADRKNYRLMITDLEGNEKGEMLMRPSEMNIPEEIKLYKDNKYIFLFSLTKSQKLRSEKNNDSYFYVFDLKNKKLLYSFGERNFISGKLNFTSKGGYLLTNWSIGDVLYTDKHTLLYAPYVYKGTMLVFKKVTSERWTFSSKIKGHKWNRPAFTDIYFNKNGRPPQNKIKKIRNTTTVAGPKGYCVGLLNIRSAGLFRLNANTIIHFSVGEFKSGSGRSFYQILYAELFDNQFNYLGSSMIMKTNNEGMIIDVYTKGKENNFFLGLQTSSYHSQILKFSIKVER